MNYYAKHANSLQAVQGRLSTDCPVIIWSGNQYMAIPGTAARRQDLVAGGLALNADLRFEILVAPFLDGVNLIDAQTLKNALLGANSAGTEVQYLGDRYKTVSVTISPGGLQLTVECNSISQFQR